MNEKQNIPYYEFSNSIISQIKNSGKHRSNHFISYILRCLGNQICQILAFNCPINLKLHRLRGKHWERCILRTTLHSG